MALTLASSKGANAAAEGVIIVVVLLLFAVFGIFLKNAGSEVGTDLISSGIVDDSNGTALLQQRDANFPSWIDGSFVLILFLLWMGSVIMAFFVDSHPVFIVISLFLVPGLLLVVASVANTAIELMESEGTTSSLPMMYFIFNHLVSFIVAHVLTVLLALYAKVKAQ